MPGVLKFLDTIQCDLYVGVDIVRRKDLTAIWCLEKLEKYKIVKKSQSFRENSVTYPLRNYFFNP